MIRVVLFDLDDTLYPERDWVTGRFPAVAQAIAARFGAPCEAEELTSLFDADVKRVYDRWLRTRGLAYTDDDMAELLRVHRSVFPKIDFYGDVRPFLSACARLGIRTGIITDGTEREQVGKLNALGAHSLFDACLVTDTLGGVQFRKPSRVPFETMKAALETRFGERYDWDEIVYIGDNPIKDFAARTALGHHTVRIVRAGQLFPDGEYLDGVREELRIASLADYLPVLEKGNPRAAADGAASSK